MDVFPPFVLLGDGFLPVRDLVDTNPSLFYFLPIFQYNFL